MTLRTVRACSQAYIALIKFCLLTLSGADRPSPQAEFAFFLYRAEQLQDADRRFVLAPEDFALFNPNTRTCPVFRTRRDADIAGKMYRRAGVFWKESRDGEPDINPWAVKFSTMFHMSNDSGLFRTLRAACRGRLAVGRQHLRAWSKSATCRYMRPSCSTNMTIGSPRFMAWTTRHWRAGMRAT